MAKAMTGKMIVADFCHGAPGVEAPTPWICRHSSGRDHAELCRKTWECDQLTQSPRDFRTVRRGKRRREPDMV